MKILAVHNEYGARSGEEVQFDHICELLSARGHAVRRIHRTTREIESMVFGKLRALLAGIHNPWACAYMGMAVKESEPDLAFVQNLFPLISPAILPVCRNLGVPVVMCVANYRLMCPNGLHMNKGEVCERCVGGREHWCVLRNCEGSLPKSVGYAVRSAVARIAGYYAGNVTLYICASQFLRQKMSDAGFAADRIAVVPNVVPDVAPGGNGRHVCGGYVGFVGRLSHEKGVPVLLEAARRCPRTVFRLAGRLNPRLTLPDPLPSNVECVGFLSGDELADFYRGSRLIVSASECYETFGLTVAEAMLHCKPVIVSRIGVFPEFVDDRVTGLLFEPGNAQDLAEKIQYLWNQPDLCRQMGQAGREKALREYSPEKYYERLMAVYKRAIELGPGGPKKQRIHADQ